MGQQVKLHRRLFFELVVTSKIIQWNKETKAEDLSTGQRSRESGHAPTAVLLLLNFLFSQEKGAKYIAGTAIGTESRHEISADKTTAPHINYVRGFGSASACTGFLLCGKIKKSFSAPNPERRKPMDRELWHECSRKDCGSIFDGDESSCPACGKGILWELHLTIKEVVQRVWPNCERIYTKQPSRFRDSLMQVKREMAVQKDQGLKAVPA